MRVIKWLVTASILLFLMLSPGWLVPNLAHNVYLDFWTKPVPSWHGRIEIWHIAEFRTYQGSVTDFLQQRADVYCKRHPGVHIDVIGLTVKRYNDRITRGAFADAYSFPSGLIYAEQLQPLEITLPDLADGISPATIDQKSFAIPYLMSSYFLVGNTQLLSANGFVLPENTTEADTAYLQSALNISSPKAPQLYMPFILAARMGLEGQLATLEQFQKGQTMLAVMDARMLGETQRASSGNLLVEAIPFTAYTDQVQYLGLSRGATPQQAAAFSEFIIFLLSETQQQRLTLLGALPIVKLENVPIFSEPLLNALYAASLFPAMPEPFSYQRHKDALYSEALAALTGDALAKTSFQERMKVVESGIF
ncbi:MAG: hypothetical protein RRZ24_09455 [Clostridia bacterium]